LNRIKELRKEQSLTQDGLAELLNVQRPTVSKYEAGIIPLTTETIQRLIEIFHVSADYLLGISDERRRFIPFDEIDDAVEHYESEPLSTAFSIIDTDDKLDEATRLLVDYCKKLNIELKVGERTIFESSINPIVPTKLKASPEGTPLTPEQQDLLAATTGLSKEDLLKTIEYAAANLPGTPYDRQQYDKYLKCDDRGKDTVNRVIDYEYNRTVSSKTNELPRLKTIKIPVSLELASAGRGYFLETADMRMTAFSETDVPEGADFAVKIKGDSMEPGIPDGCLVFIKSMPAIDSGEIGLFNLNGDGYCKELFVSFDRKRIELRSHNEKYPPITIGTEDVLLVYGRVLGVFEG
jgi:SOS-response transcriptional repressor LexA/transcriptional regulator with XRE-family HTH domain